jgi:hypothetical protein
VGAALPCGPLRIATLAKDAGGYRAGLAFAETRNVHDGAGSQRAVDRDIGSDGGASVRRLTSEMRPISGWRRQQRGGPVPSGVVAGLVREERQRSRRRGSQLGWVLALLSGFVLAVGGGAAAAAAPVQPVRSCASLTTVDLGGVDAQVSSAADHTENGALFCQVKGYLSPTTQFTALPPQATWLGDYLQQGCGGYCGHSEVGLDHPSRTSLHQAPYEPLRRGEFVVAADDQGHEGSGTLWGTDV